MRSLFLTAALAMTAACNAGAQSGAPGSSESAGARSSRSFQVGGFDKIDLTGSPDVVVAVGGQPSVRAEGDAADLERLDITVVDGELRIGKSPAVLAAQYSYKCGRASRKRKKAARRRTASLFNRAASDPAGWLRLEAHLVVQDRGLVQDLEQFLERGLLVDLLHRAELAGQAGGGGLENLPL